MRALLGGFAWLLTPPGLVALAALDASAVFFLPFALDGIVIFLSAREPDRFWLWPLLATAGSVIGASFSWWVGGRIGEHGLERFVSKPRLDRARRRVERGVWPVAALAIVPPPFPYTGYLVAGGALGLDLKRFLAAFTAVRLARFGLEATFARRFGETLVRWLRSDVATGIIVALIVVAIAGTAYGLWRAFFAPET
ncbi:MAG: VTT domain-containing protein [Gemmatimonadetes bacterium]|nr:VTT domain-containing protein [Gemmatimonadota bacterium]